MKTKLLLITTLTAISMLVYSQGPAFMWAKGMGGGGTDFAYSSAVDASGNIYTTGYFNGIVDLDPGPAMYTVTSMGVADMFITKINSAGNLIWAKQIGGAFNDYGYSITVDAAGNVFTSGYFEGTADFDPNAGVYNLTPVGGPSDIFICKLSTSGNFIWAKSFGGNGEDRAYSITLDASGNIYTTGLFAGTGDFDPGAGILNLTSNGAQDIFVSKLDVAGNLIWVKQMGGAGQDEATSITVDATGNVYTTGYFTGTVDFDPGAGANNLTSIGGWDVFISKLNSSGAFVLAKNMGGTNSSYANSIAVDATGNI